MNNKISYFFSQKKYLGKYIVFFFSDSYCYKCTVIVSTIKLFKSRLDLVPLE